MALEAQNNAFTSILMAEAADPEALSGDADPAVGQRRLVVGADHLLYLLDDSGVATLVGSSGSSDLDAIITASSGQDIADALAAAAAPDAGNAFATMADVGAGGSDLLGRTTWSTGSDAAWASLTSATAADIDATNAALAIVVPGSGAILVMIQAMISNETAQDYVYLTVNTGAGPTVLASQLVSAAVGNGFGQASFATQSSAFMFLITGLTPGALTIKAGIKSGGTGAVKVYANDGAGGAGHRVGPFVMAAWAA